MDPLDVVDRVDEATELPAGIGYEWTGQSYEEQKAGAQAGPLYAISLIVVFLCLAALYESWSIPVAVMLVVPLGVFGAILFTLLRGLENDVFFQVGLLTTVGLSAKNAILIVEFAEQLRGRGMPLVESAIQAATIRLRPILMTSLAFILGVVPLVIATGAGENGRHSVGTTVFGGMIMSTILNLFFIPVLYLIIEGWREHGKKAPERATVLSENKA